MRTKRGLSPYFLIIMFPMILLRPPPTGLRFLTVTGFFRVSLGLGGTLQQVLQ